MYEDLVHYFKFGMPARGSQQELIVSSDRRYASSAYALIKLGNLNGAQLVAKVLIKYNATFRR